MITLDSFRVNFAKLLIFLKHVTYKKWANIERLKRDMVNTGLSVWQTDREKDLKSLPQINTMCLALAV